MSIRYEIATVSTANANINGTGTIVDIATGSANGTRIDSIYIKAAGNTTDGMIRFFLWDGAAYDMIHEVSIPSSAGDALTPYYATTVRLPQMYLKSGWKIGASTQKAETFNIALNLTDL
jgi:hypothetical protein